LSGKMMLEWLAQKHGDKACAKAAETIEQAVSRVLSEEKVRTPDLCYGKYGGITPSRTSQVGDAVVRKIEKPSG
ncbi:MAG: hypothetical protein ACTSRV_06885, partial [Candidatus Freyarchaeota archaeon]